MMRARIQIFFASTLLLAYLAVLLKLLVFKYPDVHFAPEYNFIPFKTILPYLTGYPTWIVARDNLLGNIVTFIPLGFLMPLLCRPVKWKYAFATGFAVSLGIEVLQILLHAGIFDIDDLLLNTLGAVLGYGVFIAVMRIAETSGIRYSWNMKKTWLTAIMVVAVLVGGFALWKLHTPTTTVFVTPTANQAAFAQLQSDLQGVTPQFIDEHTTLSSDVLQKIEQDIIGILVAQEPNNQEYYSQNGIALSAIGKRYVAFSVLRPTDNPAPIQILDSISQTSDSYISGQLLFKTDKVAVYVDGQNIYTYKPDQSSATPLSGAKLSDNETYDHCGGCMGGNQDLQATHTDTSFTISTYMWVQGEPKKVRQITLPLP